MKMQLDVSSSLHTRLVQLGLEALAGQPAEPKVKRTYKRKAAKKAKTNGHALEAAAPAKRQMPHAPKAWTAEHRRNFQLAMKRKRQAKHTS